MKTKKGEWSVTGLVMGILLLSLCVIGFRMFMTDINSEYELNDQSNISKYDQSENISTLSQNIRDSISANPDPSFVDIIGIYFTAGVNSLKLAGSSVNNFIGLSGQASADFPVVQEFFDVLVTMILIIVFLGVVVAAIVKWRT